MAVGANPAAGCTVSVPRRVRSLVRRPITSSSCAYFLLIAFIGFWFSRGQESSEEFSLGNRRVPWWAAGISMFATGASAITFMAVPALAFRTNFVWLLPLATLVPAYFINAYYIFPLLRRMNITSTYEYLERRFNVPLAADRKRAVRAAANLRAGEHRAGAARARHQRGDRHQRLRERDQHGRGDDDLHGPGRLPGGDLDGSVPGNPEIPRAGPDDRLLSRVAARRPARILPERS